MQCVIKQLHVEGMGIGVMLERQKGSGATFFNIGTKMKHMIHFVEYPIPADAVTVMHKQ